MFEIFYIFLNISVFIAFLTGINKAYEQLIKLSADEVKRLEYEAREKAIRDYKVDSRKPYRSAGKSCK